VNNIPLNSTESELLHVSLDKPYVNNKGTLRQHRQIVLLLGGLTDSQSQLCFAIYHALFNATNFVFVFCFFFAKPSSGSTNYAKKAHPAQYKIYHKKQL
jgi:hypothetical protein